MRTLSVGLIAGLFVIAVLPPAEVKAADASCGPGWVVDQFQSVGFFSYSAGHATGQSGGLLGDAVRVEGPTVVCREIIPISDDCWRYGRGHFEVIPIEMVFMQLQSVQPPMVTVREDPDKPSHGALGPGELGCSVDPRTGERRVAFLEPVPSFFDVIVAVDVGGVVFEPERPFHVENNIPCLPEPNPEWIKGCPVKPYKHAGGSVPLNAQMAGPGIPTTIYADSACHLPFFVPSPPPERCFASSPADGSGKTTGATFRVFASDVGTHPLRSATTTDLDYSPESFFDIFVDPWTIERDGRAYTDVMVLPTTMAPSCGSGGSAGIDLKVAFVHDPDIRIEDVIHVDWCGTP